MITTVDDLIQKLGGLSATADVADVTTPAVCNWRKRKHVPADKSFVITEALKAKGEKVSPLVFGFKRKVRA